MDYLILDTILTWFRAISMGIYFPLIILYIGLMIIQGKKRIKETQEHIKALKKAQDLLKLIEQQEKMLEQELNHCAICGKLVNLRK